MLQDKMMNCMTVIVGKAVSASGRVLVAHNEDDPGHVIVRHAIVPAADHASGELIPAEKGLARIPQVPHTLGYYWVEYVEDEGGVTAADAYLNECGVVITSNSMGWSKEDDDDPNVVKDGGIGYVLRRALAERAHTAREGAHVLMALIDEWGYAPSGRAYTIADKNEAFMFQLVRGRHYVGARVPDDAVVVMPNHYTFRGLNDVEEMYYSEDLVSHAIEMGWYTPAVEGDYSDFDFAKVYQDEYSYGRDYNVLRQKYAMEILLDQEWDVAANGLPFVIKPAAPVTLDDMIEVLSTHYEGTPHEDGFGPGNSPHDTEIRKICTGTTIEATIFDLADDPLMTTAWTAFGRPCQLPFMPMHPLAGTVDEIDKMEDPTLEMEEHLKYRHQATVYQNNGWHAMRDFENLQEMVYSETIEGVTALKNEMMAEYVPANEKLVEEAAALLKEGKADEAKAKLQEADKATAIAAIEKLNAYAAENFRMVEIAEHTPFALSWPDMPYVVTFACDGKPVESEIYFGMGFTNVRQKYAPALEGTLTDLGDGMYSAAFDPFVMMDSAPCEGEYEFFLGGKTEDGRAFTGMTMLTFTE